MMLPSSNASSSSLSLSFLSKLELKYRTTPDKRGLARYRGVAPATGDNDVAMVVTGKAHREGSSLQLASSSPRLVAAAAVASTAALAAGTKTIAIAAIIVVFVVLTAAVTIAITAAAA